MLKPPSGGRVPGPCPSFCARSLLPLRIPCRQKKHVRRPLRLPRVSLIVPVNGAERGLQETLRLVAAQDYPDFELIVAAPFADCVPAGSLPGSVKVALSGEKGRIAVLQAGVRAARRSSEL